MFGSDISSDGLNQLANHTGVSTAQTLGATVEPVATGVVGVTGGVVGTAGVPVGVIDDVVGVGVGVGSIGFAILSENVFCGVTAGGVAHGVRLAGLLIEGGVFMVGVPVAGV